MPKNRDFEQAWLAKFSTCLGDIAGEKIRAKVMQGSEGLTSDSNREDVIGWTQQAVERLESLVDGEKRRAIMTGCACQYPKAGLKKMKEVYAETGDVALVHQLLQEQFESFLADHLNLGDELIEEIVRRGWGLAGIRQGNTIIATKIPKSGYLVEYLQEADPAAKRQFYCHCPRVRDALKTGETIAPVYCYCGAGFYKDIWEEILQKPVEVEVLETVLDGGEVCKIAIHLD